MKNILIIVISMFVLAAGWFFVSPLFIDEAVNEEFNFAAEGGGVDMGAIMKMPESKRVELKQEIMDAAAAAPDAMESDGMPSDSPIVIGTGNFVDADAIHKGSGQATVYEISANRHIVRFEDFRTTNGPALVVYLAKHAAPTQASDVIDGGFIKLGKLKGNVGNQNYEVPEGTEIADFHSVVIWCELFDVLFSPASLMASN